MIRSTLGQVQLSQLPQAIGAVASDLPTIAAAVNRSQQTLIDNGGETGWVGGWAKVVFKVCRTNPFITLPREFSRAVGLDACRFPMRIQNQFYEYLEAGVGKQEFRDKPCWHGAIEGYDRGGFSTMVDLAPANQFLRVYVTDQRDITARILFSGATDQNGNGIYSQDGNNTVNGFYLNFSPTFTTSTFIVTGFSGIQKDLTYGDILLYQVDAATGAQVLLSRFSPDELIPSYRRYYINHLPCGCAPCLTQSPCITPLPNPPHVLISAIAKLEFIPATRATDFLIIGNIPALIEECKANRYSDMDAANAPQLEAKCHAKAIRLLNNELGSYLGKYNIAINVSPFGTARLIRALNAVRHG